MQLSRLCQKSPRIHIGVTFPTRVVLGTILGLCIMIFLLGIEKGSTAKRVRQLIVVRVPDESCMQYNLPSRSQIKCIEAEMYNVHGLLGRLPSIERFTVPPSHYDSVLAFFTHPRVDRSPTVDVSSSGSLKITDRHGVVIQIVFFDRLGKGPLEYSIKGVRCYDGRERHDYNDALTLDARLRYAHEQADVAIPRSK